VLPAGHRRLEDFEGRGVEALKAFDSRLASAAAVLRQAGFWEEAMGRGGSSPNLLQLARTESNTPPEVGRGTPHLIHQDQDQPLSCMVSKKHKCPTQVEMQTAVG